MIWGYLFGFLLGLLFVAQVWFAMVWCYRMGFRAAVDFLNGDISLPPLIISWRGALRKERPLCQPRSVKEFNNHLNKQLTKD
jgi:hypothetical protein